MLLILFNNFSNKSTFEITKTGFKLRKITTSFEQNEAKRAKGT